MVTDRKRKLHIAVTAAVMAFIFVQSALPGDLSGAESNIIVQLLHGLTGMDAETLSLFVRKAAHFTEYLILGICLAVNARDQLQTRGMEHTDACNPDNAADRSLITHGNSGNSDETAEYNTTIRCWKCWLTAWLIGTAYAGADEIPQLFVPDRACACFDVCIDSAGVAVGLAIAVIILKHRRSY